MTSFRYQCSTTGHRSGNKGPYVDGFRKKREGFCLFELVHPSDGFSILQATILLTLIRIVIFFVFFFFNLQFTGHITKHNGTTKQRQSTMTAEEKRLHKELLNGSTNSTSPNKHPKRTHNCSDGNISLHVSMSKTQRKWTGPQKWHSVREFVYCETFIVGVDEFSLKLFSVVFTTFNLYYWLTIFYFSDSVK